MSNNALEREVCLQTASQNAGIHLSGVNNMNGGVCNYLPPDFRMGLSSGIAAKFLMNEDVPSLSDLTESSIGCPTTNVSSL